MPGVAQLNLFAARRTRIHNLHLGVTHDTQSELFPVNDVPFRFAKPELEILFLSRRVFIGTSFAALSSGALARDVRPGESNTPAVDNMAERGADIST